MRNNTSEHAEECIWRASNQLDALVEKCPQLEVWMREAEPAMWRLYDLYRDAKPEANVPNPLDVRHFDRFSPADQLTIALWFGARLLEGRLGVFADDCESDASMSEPEHASELRDLIRFSTRPLNNQAGRYEPSDGYPPVFWKWVVARIQKLAKEVQLSTGSLRRADRDGESAGRLDGTASDRGSASAASDAVPNLGDVGAKVGEVEIWRKVAWFEDLFDPSTIRSAARNGKIRRKRCGKQFVYGVFSAQAHWPHRAQAIGQRLDAEGGNRAKAGRAGIEKEEPGKR